MLQQIFDRFTGIFRNKLHFRMKFACARDLGRSFGALTQFLGLQYTYIHIEGFEGLRLPSTRIPKAGNSLSSGFARPAWAKKCMISTWELFSTPKGPRTQAIRL